ncbi:MAG TPA: hypothetical protein VNQ76_17010 [Planctomicrobium sp.]|nr:hypothetical protein [Planctomicrobium sp.]
MNKVIRVPFIAILLLVLLRMSIGWQFLYEGLWKHATLKTPTPWTSEGYLKNAQGPLRDYFRDMTGDPDEVLWLDYPAVSSKWYNWRDRFVNHYGLDEAQQNTLNALLDGSTTEDTAAGDLPPAKQTSVSLAELPEGVTADKLKSIATYDAAKKTLTVNGPLLPSEEANLLKLAGIVRNADGSLGTSADEKQALAGAMLTYAKAVERLANLSRQLSYRHRLAAQLRGNPENVGVTGRKNERGSFDITMGTISVDESGEQANLVRYGKIQEYKDLVKDYNDSVSGAKVSYQTDHANMLGRKLAIMRGELVAPIKTLDKDLKTAATNLLTTEQLKRGTLPTDSPLAKSDRQVMWGLIVLGFLLIAGLGTRVAAILGAVLLMMFYMVMPPWPGVPEVPGPEHSFIVNKNMIEAIALLAIAALPTGSWFGIDSLFARCCLCRKKPAPQTVELKTPAPKPVEKPVPAPAKK